MAGRATAAVPTSRVGIIGATVAIGLALVVFAGCSIGPAPRPSQALHDFGIEAGPVASAVRLRSTLAVPDPSAPGWLDTTSMVYRFKDVDGGRPRQYADSRWTAPPVELLGARLRSRLAPLVVPGLASSRDGVTPDHVLRIELEEFTQVFDGPSTSRGVLRARVTLIGGARRMTIAQRVFALERPAPSPDAKGGAAALAAASDALVGEVIDWLVVTLPEPAAPSPSPSPVPQLKTAPPLQQPSRPLP